MLSDQVILVLPLLYLALQIAALSWMPEGWLRAAAWPAVAMGVALVFFALGIVLNAAIAPVLLALALPVASVYLAGLWIVYGAVVLRRTAA